MAQAGSLSHLDLIQLELVFHLIHLVHLFYSTYIFYIFAMPMLFLSLFVLDGVSILTFPNAGDNYRLLLNLLNHGIYLHLLVGLVKAAIIMLL